MVRLETTGAVIPVVLTHDIDRKRSPLLNPLRPVQGKIKMGTLDKEGFLDCELQINWESQQIESFPPPQSYKKLKPQPL